MYIGKILITVKCANQFFMESFCSTFNLLGGESFNTHSLPRSRASRSPRLDRRKFEVPDECDEIYGEAPPKPCRMPTSSLPPRASNYQVNIYLQVISFQAFTHKII